MTRSLVESHMYRFPVRVYVEDTDAGGVVYHANYLKYFERARSEWLRDQGFSQQQLLASGVQFVVARCDVRYLRPALLDDALEVTVVVGKRGRASLVFQQQLLRDGRVLAEAEIKAGCVDPQTLRPIALPAGVSLS